MFRFKQLSLVVLIILSLFIGGQKVWACINDYDFSPTKTHFGTLRPRIYINRLKAGFEKPKDDELATKKSAAEAGSFEKKSDYAVALIKLGRSKEAIEILEPLAAEHPKEYNIAANLGTAYELVGENAKALQWITKGYELNPESHSGTEWLHIKILEAKIAQEKDPDWFKKNSILGLDFGAESTPEINDISATVMEFKGDRKPLTAAQDALEYQLHERLGFVKHRDAVVADLLFNLGNILMVKNAPQHAELVYDLAAEYAVDPLDSKVLARQAVSKKAADSQRFWNGVKNLPNNPVVVISFIVISAYLMMKFIVKRARRVMRPATV